MSTNLIPFTHEQFGQIRIIKDEATGEPWFVARDVAMALGYDPNSKVGMLFRHIPDLWSGVNRIYTNFGTRTVTTLSEQGLYFFLGRSDKPNALPFQMWLAGEVLPSIRKTGGYIVDRPDDTPEAIMARAVLVAQETIDRMAGKLKETINRRLTYPPLLLYQIS